MAEINMSTFIVMFRLNRVAYLNFPTERYIPSKASCLHTSFLASVRSNQAFLKKLGTFKMGG